MANYTVLHKQPLPGAVVCIGDGTVPSMYLNTQLYEVKLDHPPSSNVWFDSTIGEYVPFIDLPDVIECSISAGTTVSFDEVMGTTGTATLTKDNTVLSTMAVSPELTTLSLAFDEVGEYYLCCSVWPYLPEHKIKILVTP